MVESFDVLARKALSALVKLNIKQRDAELVTIDDVFADQPLDFMKIDVEGFESGVLQGMGTTLAVQQQVIMVEVQAAEV